MMSTIKKYRYFLAAIPGLLGVFVIHVLGCRQRTVILVRHAERGPGTDPPLNNDGQARAAELAAILGASGVSNILVTQFLRTQQTAQPLADALGLSSQIINVDPADLAGYIDDVCSLIHSSLNRAVILVVSHNNTIPLIIESLGAGTVPAIAEDDFDHLFIVTVPRWIGIARLIRARYGAPTAA